MSGSVGHVERFQSRLLEDESMKQMMELLAVRALDTKAKRKLGI